jgi:hypothetical protein
MSFRLPTLDQSRIDPTVLYQFEWNKLSAYGQTQAASGSRDVIDTVLAVEMDTDWQRAIVLRFAEIIEQGDERITADDDESLRISAAWLAVVDAHEKLYGEQSTEPATAPEPAVQPAAGAEQRASRVRQAVIDQLRSEFAHDDLLETLMGVILVSQKTASLITGLDVSTLSKFAMQGRGPLVWPTDGSRVPRYRLVDLIEWSLGEEL